MAHGDKDGKLQLFDLNTRQLVGRPVSRFDWGDEKKIGFAPDGNRLAKVGDDQTGAVGDLRTGRMAVPPFKHGGSLLDLDWSPDGTRLLTAGLAHDARIWDAATGEQLLSPLAVGSTHGRAARWSADGRFIVTRSDDNFARVWDAATAEAVTPLLRHSGYIRFACITPGNRLITASDPNLLRAWDLKPTLLEPDLLADYAKLLSGRRLNAGGVLLPLKANELAELNRSLRARAPQLCE